jgi:pimeloyl-ACP methyl ester carboxylesterase
VLLLWGDRDPVVPLRAGRATQARLPQSRLERFATGHVVFSSDPDGFLARLLPFLDEVAAATGRESQRDG